MIYDFQSLADIFAQIPSDAPKAIVDMIRSHTRVFLYGAGRSGLMLKALAIRLSQAGIPTFVVGETITPAIANGDLLILASASGSTPSVVRCAQTAQKIGSTVYSITASQISPLVESSNYILCLSTPTKDSKYASTVMGTMFEQSVLLLGDEIIKTLDIDADQMRARHANLE